MQTYETTRLLMRPLRAKDQELYFACYTDPILMRHIGPPLSPEAALRSFLVALKIPGKIPMSRYTWAMEEKASGNVVGLLAMIFDQTNSELEPVHAELGHIMLAEYQKRGFTLEASIRLLDIVFTTTRLDALIVNHASKNLAVSQAAKKLGFLPDPADARETSGQRWVISRAHWQALKTKANPV